jgi:hypothetical protein
MRKTVLFGKLPDGAKFRRLGLTTLWVKAPKSEVCTRQGKRSLNAKTDTCPEISPHSEDVTFLADETFVAPG